ncbi:phage major capsid protein [Luteimonas sp. TWI662]|uniref:phage major capsid protein n=1 Tax=Luteimonas sp. TWI662 TaxID=3136789 RepID=UPI00320A91E8
MAFTQAQFIRGMNYSLETFEKKEPIDQINPKYRMLAWLIANKEETVFGNGVFREPLFVDNGSNAQNYFGADQVTYNERDPAVWTRWQYYNVHDGFWFDEDRLLAAGIRISDDGDEAPTQSEKTSLINLLKQSKRGLDKGMQRHLAFEFMLDGSQSAKAAPGVSHIISTTPAVGTVGGVNAATRPYWRNNINLNVPQSGLVDAFEDTWSDNTRYGGAVTDAIFAGDQMYNAFRKAANAVTSRHVNEGGNNRGGVSLDPSTNNLYFHGVEVIKDPTFEELDAELGGDTFSKRAYFVSKANLKLRPVKGEWMRNRKPERLPDRYVHYWAKTAKYGLTTDQRNGLAVVTLA